MIKNLSLSIAVMLTLFIGSVCAQTVGSNPAFDGWNCNDPSAEPGFCTRTLSKSETAWDFAGTLFNNHSLWNRFVEDNPDKTIVRKDAKGNPILIWKEGATVRIRKTDLTNIQNGTVVPDAKAPVTVTIQEESWWAFPGIFGPIALIVLTFLAGLAFAYWLIRRLTRSARLRENPRDPEFFGRPMRSDFDHTLNVAPTRREMQRTLSRVRESGGGIHQRPFTRRKRTISARITLPEGATVPVEFRNGTFDARPINNLAYFDIYHDGEGAIVNLVGAFSRCSNGLLLGSMTPAELARFAQATLTDAKVIVEDPNLPAFSLDAVHAFLRGLASSEAPAQETQSATTEAAPTGEAAQTQPAQDSSQALSQQEIHFGRDGWVIRGGKINLAGGAKLDLTEGGEVSIKPDGKASVGDLPLNLTPDVTDVSDETRES